MPPTIIVISPAKLLIPRTGASLMIMNTPALTIVEEWSNADVGVGATIAPSSQLLNGICAALVIPANAKNAAGIATRSPYTDPIRSMEFSSTVWNTIPRITIPTANPRPPSKFMISALNALFVASSVLV